MGHRWYAPANAANLDRSRTWHLVRTLLADSDIDLILVDRDVQKLLKVYAREIGEDPAWLDQIFQVGGKSARPVIFHAKGHAAHLHIRFYSPMAQELGRRASKPGETLCHLALRCKVTPEAIRKANAMTNDLVRVTKPYKIPQTGMATRSGSGTPTPSAVASTGAKRGCGRRAVPPHLGQLTTAIEGCLRRPAWVVGCRP